MVPKFVGGFNDRHNRLYLWLGAVATKKIETGGKRLKTDGKRRISAGLAPAAVHVTTAKFRIISTFSASRIPTPPPLQTVTASQTLVSLIFFGVSRCHRAVPRPSQAVTVSWLMGWVDPPAAHFGATIRLHPISARRANPGLIYFAPLGH